MSWSAENYFEFATSHQVGSLWQIANWIVRMGDAANIFTQELGPIVDLGAGPGHLSHMVAVLRGRMVDAAVQSEAFINLAKSLPLPRQLMAPTLVRLHLDPEAELNWLTQCAQMVYCYACLHEYRDPSAVIKRAYKTLIPGGMLVVVDTLRECAQDVERLLASSTLSPDYCKAVVKTFAASLSLAEAREILFEVNQDAEVEILTFDDELLFESSINLPVEIEEEAELSFSYPSLFSAVCYKNDFA